MLPILLLTFVFGSSFSVPVEDKLWKCGYDSCTQAEAGVLNVHIVAHTHDDVGWLKTVDQYYYGSRNNIQKAGVQYILDSVVKELWEDPKRRFMYVETAFFWKWWTKQSDGVKHKVQALVRQGRLQFVGGAWSMNDEAATHYQSTIDQFTWGLRKLNHTFGPCGLPRVGWQIDPFGHSREFASLLAAMGYDGLFLGRIDFQDKENRKSKKTMEMLWRGDDDLGPPSDIFTGVLYNTYSPPAGFCFDVLCNDEPLIDDVNSPMYNVDERVDSFLAYVQDQAAFYRSNNAILTMGGDFTYQDAGMWYRNLDKLIEYANLKAAKDGLNFKLFYSTPDCYLKAVKDANPTLPTKQDDFFPYASDSTAYWTGYFTSRPTTKYFERQGNSYLQMVKQIQVNAGLQEHNRFVLNELMSAMGIMQHHDAVTGTEKQHVASDYERILNSAIDDALLITRQGLNKLVQGDALKPPLLTLDRCKLNISECATSENSQKFVVTLYNPLAWKVDSAPVRIPVTDGVYAVFAPNGDQIDAQLVELPEAVKTIPLRTSKATHDLVFLAYNLKPQGYKNFYVKKLQQRKKRYVEALDRIDRDDAEKRVDELSANVNDYWKNVKEKSFAEIKNIEQENLECEEENVPVYVNTDNDKYRDPTLAVLKDKNDEGPTPNIVELGKLLKEARMKMIRDLEMRDEELKGDKPDRRGNMPNFEGVDMRLLADEPRLVERIPEDTILENEVLKLRINNTTGKITHVTYGDEETVFDVQMLFYPGCAGNNTAPPFRSSGAYIFRPNATNPTELLSNYSGKVIKGKVVDEVQYSMNEYVSFTMRLYKDKKLNFIENDWVIGSIPIEDGIGKEVVVRYITDIINNGEFKTDSNGRQMLKRKMNQRPDYNLTILEPIAANYYPVTNRISIEDESKRMSVITDRAQGGTSLDEGDIELMLHRRLLRDDAFGVDEALNETVNGLGLNVRGTHRIILSKTNDIPASIDERKNVLKTQLAPHVFVSDAGQIEYEQWLKLENCLGGLKNPLPEGVHLLTLEPWDRGDILVRLENIFEVADGNSDVEVDVSNIFSWLKIKGLKETTLAANHWVGERQKWKWEKETDFVANFNDAYGSFVTPLARGSDGESKINGLKITLKAKQIRTFIVSYDYVSS